MHMSVMYSIRAANKKLKAPNEPMELITIPSALMSHFLLTQEM
jgi:hypothetical protein